MKTHIAPGLAPASGPYCHGVRTGNLFFVSGQAPFDERGNVVGKDMAEQTDQTMKNLAAVLSSCGLALSDVVKTTVYITDLDEFPKMNAVYAQYFGDHRPARATIEASRLANSILVEIEAIAECANTSGASK